MPPAHAAIDAVEQDWDDTQFMALLAADPQAAMDQLYHHLAPPLYSLAYGVLHNAADAEEVMHDALLRFWRVQARFDPQRGTLEIWLRTITYRLALSRLRYERRRPSLGGMAPDDARRGDRPASDPLPDAVVLAAEQHQAMRDLVQTLPPAQRQVLAYAYSAQFSQAEIAATLQVPLGTIKARLRRALAALKTQITQSPPDTWSISRNPSARPTLARPEDTASGTLDSLWDTP